MKETKRLKRGLKDISALFQETSQTRESSAVVDIVDKASVTCVNLYSPERGDSNLFSAFLGSQLAKASSPCTIVNLEGYSVRSSSEKKSEHILDTYSPHHRRIHCGWEQIESLWHKQGFEEPEPGLCGHEIILFDFDYLQVVHFERMITLLDKWIGVIRPSMEALTETYKVMKSLKAFNPYLEFFVILEGDVQDPKLGRLFEKFSEMAASRLGITLQCLGGVQWSRRKGLVPQPLELSRIFENHNRYEESIEKRRLVQFIKNSLIEQSGHCL